MVDETIKKFVEKHINLIEAKDFAKIYELIDTNEAYDYEDEEGLYYNCGKLTDLFYKIGIDPLEGSKEIYPNMFVRSEIDHFTFPKGICQIGNAAFYDCSNLKHIVIPFGVKKIPFECFGNTYLESIELPLSIASIDEEAFASDNVFKVICEEGSYAESWANEQGLVTIPTKSYYNS